MMNIRRCVKKYLRNRLFYQNSIGFAAEEREYSKIHNATQLSQDEISVIRKTWSGICYDPRIGFPGYRAFKLQYGFNVEYMPMALFFPWIARILSPIDVARVFANKGMTYAYFQTIPQPELVVRRVNNNILDKGGDSLVWHEMIRLIGGQNYDMIIKQSSGSYSGLAVKIIRGNDRIDKIEETINSYTGDFVIQRVLKQSDSTARFNASSLNTFRVSTLLLNGKFSLCTAMLRFGNPGSIVDNIGAGGGCVGINDDGTFMPYGFTKTGERIDSWNDVKFDGCKVPHFDKVIETARKAHLCIPLCAFVGWDLAIDENGEVNLIEANIEGPGLFFEQLANGRPVFRERFEEVMRYVKEHPLPLTPMYDAVN